MTTPTPAPSGSWWLVKTEPGDYSLSDLARDGTSVWDGVRNPAALRHMRAMAPGDRVLVYHTGEQRAIVGLAEVARAAYPDPASGETVVDLRFAGALANPVSLAQAKAAEELSGWALVRQPRLSVMPVPPAALRLIEAWAGGFPVRV
jgi:predicted RNA-binding protein with PUA-like domain